MKTRQTMRRCLFHFFFITSAAIFGVGCGEQSNKEPEIWGRIIDPRGTCQVVWANRAIEMQIPPGVYDLSSNKHHGNHAPRVIHPVTGDFVVEVKVTGDFDPGFESFLPDKIPFFGAGLLLWQNETNYVRLERAEYAVRNKRYRFDPLFEYWRNGNNLAQTRPLAEPFLAMESAWLRFSRVGDQLTAAHSYDGFEWVSHAPITIELPTEIGVGVAAISTSKKPFSVKFSYFKITGGAIDVDP